MTDNTKCGARIASILHESHPSSFFPVELTLIQAIVYEACIGASQYCYAFNFCIFEIA